MCYSHDDGSSEFSESDLCADKYFTYEVDYGHSKLNSDSEDECITYQVDFDQKKVNSEFSDCAYFNHEVNYGYVSSSDLESSGDSTSLNRHEEELYQLECHHAVTVRPKIEDQQYQDQLKDKIETRGSSKIILKGVDANSEVHNQVMSLVKMFCCQMRLLQRSKLTNQIVHVKL